MTEADITEDRLFGGRVTVRQPARGYRVNVDTILLSAAVDPAPGSRVMEAGCGIGAALIGIVSRTEVSGVGVESDEKYARCAAENLALNNLAKNAQIICADALDLANNWGQFDAVFFNPPFAQPGEGRDPNEARRAAHITARPMRDWVGALANRLTGDGVLTFIHRADILTELLGAVEGRLGGIDVLPVRPRSEEPAKRVIIRARKGSRAPLRLLKGIDLHDASGAKHTPETEAILRGERLISWS